MRRPPLLRSLPLIGAATIAACLFLWQLGSSSFFIDEAESVRVASMPLSDLLPRLRFAENNPGGYFAFLHVWINLVDSRAEWVARLPSALCGIGLVFAVWRLACITAGQRAAAIAALLVAVSPLMLQYAQQARTYVPAGLVLTLAAIAAVEASRKGSWRWALAGAIGCMFALSLHYVSLAVVAPLCAWVLSRRELKLRMRLVFCVLPALAFLAWLPLAWSQHKDHPHADVGAYGTLTAGHAVRVLGAPFDDRYTANAGLLKVLAAVAMIGAVVALAARIKRESAELKLILGLALLPPCALFAAAAAGVHILNSRYVSFAVPFLLVTVGAVVARLAVPLALVLLGLLVGIALVGSVGSHRKRGFYPDTRAVITAIDGSWRPGDLVLDREGLGIHFPLVYYAEVLLPRGASVVYAGDPSAGRALVSRRRVWVVQAGASATAPSGYRIISQRRFPGVVDLTVALAVQSR